MNPHGASELAFGPGDVLAGKYRIERVIGRGGMGVVLAAHHLLLDEPVALKFLLPGSLGNPEAIGRFVREARAAAKIKNDHVVRVSDVGQLEDGRPYIVMDRLEGLDLAGMLRPDLPGFVGLVVTWKLPLSGLVSIPASS